MLPTPAGQLQFQEYDTVIRPAVASTGEWEPQESRLIARLLKARSGAFFDLGAHVGYHTAVQLAWNRELFAVAVEANSGTYDLLWRNLFRELGDRAEVLKAAVWSDSVTSIQLENGETGNGGDWRAIPTIVPSAITVPSITVDELVSRYLAEPPRPGRVSVIKSDLQGRDHIALRGAWGTMVQQRPDIVVEFCPRMIREAPFIGEWAPTPEDVLHWYQECHYGVRLLDGTVMGDPAAIVRMSEFLPGGDVTLWLQPVERLKREV
jgi:FkbM family methyltransferase